MGIIGDLAGVAGNLFGDASGIKRRAERRAGDIAAKGFDTAKTFQQPIYDQALKQSQDLAGQYNSGAFNNPDYKAYDAGKFSFDPNSVFQDPEYKAQLSSGRDALEGGAASKGMLFSGNTAKALDKYGSDLFANRSNDLYGRKYDEFTGNRAFGANEASKAYNSGVANNATRFQEGQDLAAPLQGVANNLSSLTTGRSDTLANTELGVGNTRANGINGAFESIGNLGDSAVDLGTQALALGTGVPPGVVGAVKRKGGGLNATGQTDLGVGRDYSNIG